MENKDCPEIIFIRHAETDYDDWTGRDPSDGELTARGEEQSNALGVETHVFRFSLENVLVTAVSFCRDGNVVLCYVNG
ncbi:MAG: phosphoglycerate mutase family protein [Clostridia bacterium]|nr:phosphoglycerate mutase family protein [Clostridia bacterium]